MRRLRDVLRERAGSFFRAQPSAAVNAETETAMRTSDEPTDELHTDPKTTSVSATDANTENRTRSEVELLLEEGATPEAYFIERIAENDGRVRQKTLVAKSGLSESTVSRMLSEMESEGSILRHRIGRENIVCLPGSEPMGFQSPMDGQKD